eukprot:m.119579 g.119579  ORF g.119579 m.119579 type:complete len:133 (-) comp15598_c0_seq2:3279-3677(-)
MIMVVVGDLSNFDGSAYYSFPDVLQRNIDTEVGSRESQVKADDDLEAQRAAILHQFHYENIEILAIVEGVDPYTAATVQARHSYTLDDIVFEHTFAPCVTRGSDGACQLVSIRSHKHSHLLDHHAVLYVCRI